MTAGRLSIGPILVVVALAFAGHLSPAVAQPLRFWTTIGSAGTVDEADTGLVAFNGAVASVKAGKTGTVNLRYNVVPVDGLFGGDGLSMAVKFRDNGPAARVVARLKRYDVVAGTTSTLLTVDSDDFDPRSGFQIRESLNCGGQPSFGPNAYFVDVEMTKGAGSGTPGLAAIVVSLSLCP